MELEPMMDEEREAPSASAAVGLEEVPDYAALAKLVGIEVSSGSSEWSGEEEERYQRSRSAASLSITSISRAEAILQKHLPLVRGGTHVQFTRDDLQRIRDPEVLQFLEDNSAMFTKYMRPAEAKEEVQPTPKGVSAAEVQATILEFQREIDTFITAVDDQGHRYNIQLDENGTLQVPVDDEHPFDDESSEDSAPSPPSVCSSNSSTVPDTKPPVAAIETEGKVTPLEALTERPPALNQPDGEPIMHEGEVSSMQVQGKKVVSMAPSSSKSSPSSLSRPKKQVKLAPGVKETKPPRTKAKMASGQRQNPPPVRPVRAFLPEEDARVDELLHCDIPTTIGPNPFHLSEVQRSRLSEIDKALEKMRNLRGPTKRTSQRYVLPGSSHTTSGERGAGSTYAIGNRYLHEMKEKQKAERVLAALNSAIQKNQEESGRLALHALDDTPEDIRQMRPDWARLEVPLATEAEVAEMLEEARLEEAKAQEEGVGRRLSHTDPYAPLLSSLREAAARAERLTAQEAARPLRITSFSATDADISDSSAEMMDIPESIREDLLEMN